MGFVTKRFFWSLATGKYGGFWLQNRLPLSSRILFPNATTYLFSHLFTYLLIHLFIHLFIYLFIYLFIHLFTYLFIYLFIYLFFPFLIYWLIYLFILVIFCKFFFLGCPAWVHEEIREGGHGTLSLIPPSSEWDLYHHPLSYILPVHCDVICPRAESLFFYHPGLKEIHNISMYWKNLR